MLLICKETCLCRLSRSRLFDVVESSLGHLITTHAFSFSSSRSSTRIARSARSAAELVPIAPVARRLVCLSTTYYMHLYVSWICSRTCWSLTCALYHGRDASRRMSLPRHRGSRAQSTISYRDNSNVVILKTSWRDVHPYKDRVPSRTSFLPSLLLYTLLWIPRI